MVEKKTKLESLLIMQERQHTGDAYVGHTRLIKIVVHLNPKL